MNHLPQVLESGRPEHGQPYRDQCGGDGSADDAVVDIIRSLAGRDEQDVQALRWVMGYGCIGAAKRSVIAAFDGHHLSDGGAVVVEQGIPRPCQHLRVAGVDFYPVSLRE